jgi:hypothetical protein
MVSTFGPGVLASFLLRRFDLDAALEQISRVIGARVQAVRMPFAEAAIDGSPADPSSPAESGRPRPVG